MSNTKLQPLPSLVVLRNRSSNNWHARLATNNQSRVWKLSERDPKSSAFATDVDNPVETNDDKSYVVLSSFMVRGGYFICLCFLNRIWRKWLSIPIRSVYHPKYGILPLNSGPIDNCSNVVINFQTMHFCQPYYTPILTVVYTSVRKSSIDSVTFFRVVLPVENDHRCPSWIVLEFVKPVWNLSRYCGLITGSFPNEQCRLVRNVAVSSIVAPNQSWSLSNDLANASAPFRWVLSAKGLYCFNKWPEILWSPNDWGKINFGEKVQIAIQKREQGLFNILLIFIKSGSVPLHNQELRITRCFIFRVLNRKLRYRAAGNRERQESRLFICFSSTNRSRVLLWFWVV